MTVVVVNNIQGADQSFYEQISSRVMPNSQLPNGCRDHIAGPTDDGWRVISVWDSDDQFQQFRSETLIPAIEAAGESGRVAPSIETSPVHRHITA